MMARRSLEGWQKWVNGVITWSPPVQPQEEEKVLNLTAGSLSEVALAIALVTVRERKPDRQCFALLFGILGFYATARALPFAVIAHVVAETASDLAAVEPPAVCAHRLLLATATLQIREDADSLRELLEALARLDSLDALADAFLPFSSGIGR